MLLLLRLAVTLLLLGHLVRSIDWREIVSIIPAIDPVAFSVSYLAALVSAIPLSMRLQYLLEPTSLRFTLGKLAGIHFMTFLYALILPAGVGPAVARWYKITRNESGRTAFLVITLLEKVMLMFTLSLGAALPLTCMADTPAIRTLHASVLPATWLIVFVSATVLWAFSSERAQSVVARAVPWVAGHLGAVGRRYGSSLGEGIALYRGRGRSFRNASLAHLVFQVLMCVQLYFVFGALHVDLPLPTLLWVSMLVLLVTQVPISIGGIGLRESAFAGILGLYGVETSVGAMVGGLLTLQLFLHALIGAVVELAALRSDRRQDVPGG